MSDRPGGGRGGGSGAARPRPAAPADGSPRPQTAYMVFVNANRARLLAENPGITIPDLGKKCGEASAPVLAPPPRALAAF